MSFFFGLFLLSVLGSLGGSSPSRGFNSMTDDSDSIDPENCRQFGCCYSPCRTNEDCALTECPVCMEAVSENSDKVLRFCSEPAPDREKQRLDYLDWVVSLFFKGLRFQLRPTQLESPPFNRNNDEP